MKKSIIKKIFCVAMALALVTTSVFAQNADNAAKADKVRVEKTESEKQAEKAAQAAEKQAAKEKAAAEKQAAKEKAAQEKQAALAAKNAQKAAAKAEKEKLASEKLAAKIAAMTPEQKAKYDAKQAEKAKLKAQVEADRAMRKATWESTKPTAELPKLQIDLQEGVELAKVSRVVLKENRSNFVYSDTLLGAYVTAKTAGFELLNPMVKLSLLAGLGETFNDAKVSTTTFNFGVDTFLGVDYKANFWDFAALNITPGVHMLYQNTDRFNYLNLGLGGYFSVELPLAYEWTLVLGGQATYDWGNFGDNFYLETYDHVWQTSFDLGVRYSTKQTNKFNYLGDSAELRQVKRDRVKEFKAQKAAEKAAKKQASKEATKARQDAKKATQQG